MTSSSWHFLSFLVFFFIKNAIIDHLMTKKYILAKQITLYLTRNLHNKNWRFYAFSIIFDAKLTSNWCHLTSMCVLSQWIFIWHTNRLQILIQTIINTIEKWYCGHLHVKNCRFCAFSIIFDVKLASIDVNMCAISENIHVEH